MKKLGLAVALATMFSTAALAGDYDNTSVKVTAQSEAYSLSVNSPKTGATEFAVGTQFEGVGLTGKWMREGSTDNYAVEAGKSWAIPSLPVYAGAKGEFTFGDSYTSDTRTLVVTPFIGASATFDKVTPFAEVGYTFKSTQKDLLDMSRNDSYIKVGASLALTATTDLAVSIEERRDADFANAGDRQAEVGLNIKF